MAFIRASILVALLVSEIHPIQAQGVRKTMLEQLAALKGYIITAEKGYRITEEGLHLVRDVKSGEFLLHQVFFGSLKTVDEATLQYSPLAGSYKMIASIDEAFAQALQTYKASGWLRETELKYIQGLQQQAARQGRDDEKELQTLTTDGTLNMTDGERIRRIKEITTSIQASYSQAKSFLSAVSFLIAQRQKEHAYTGTLKKWYGIQ